MGILYVVAEAVTLFCLLPPPLATAPRGRALFGTGLNGLAGPGEGIRKSKLSLSSVNCYI